MGDFIMTLKHENKIKIMRKYYFGFPQGYIVLINNKKFPKKRGYVYAHNENNKAIKTALKELKEIQY
jgi:hypothetical protein